MNSLAGLILVVGVVVLGIKGLIAIWFFNWFAALIVVLCAMPLLPIIGLLSFLF